MSYELIDSGDKKKLERFGDILLIRPCSQALWRPSLEKQAWEKADAIFSREEENRWTFQKPLKSSWVVEIEGIKMVVEPTSFGHVGLFPEHAIFWKKIREKLSKKSSKPWKVLNLFAYSGGASIAAALAKAEVCHLDASIPMIQRAKENASLNSLEKAPIRWIVDDAIKFIKREIRRENFYDGIILDPPTFGRGPKKEMFKIEEELFNLISLCKDLLSSKALFLILTTHTPGITSLVLQNILIQVFNSKKILANEMVLPSKKSLSLPSGHFAMWESNEN